MNTSAAALILVAALAAGPEVTVKPLEGESQTGRLEALSAREASIATSGKTQTLPATGLMWVEFSQVELDEQPSVWLELLDGSKVQATGFASTDGNAKVELVSGQTIEMPLRAVRAVRFREQSPELADQWRAILAGDAVGDLLVVRKESTRTVDEGTDEPTTVTEYALDQLDGTVGDVGAETLSFDAGGETVNARIDKLEGIVFFRPGERSFSAPVCRLIDAGGSAWALRDVSLHEGALKGTTVGGVPLELPLAAVAKVDFSAGNVQFLAELAPDTGDGVPSVSLQPANMAYKFGRVFQVRTSPPLGAAKFSIGGKRFDGGLSLHSPLTLVYRVPEGFRRFRAVVGIDDSLVAPGEFELVILGDGKELMRQRYGGDEPRTPLPIDLDIEGVRRISIVLDPADGQDIGDQLNLCEARFTK